MDITKKDIKAFGWIETAEGDFRMAYTYHDVDCYGIVKLKPMGFWLEIYGQYGLIASCAVDSFEDIGELNKYTDKIIRNRGIA